MNEHHPGYILITAAKNEEQYIAKALEAVVSQTVTPFAWFIMDDGSTDKTAEVVQKFAADFPFIQLHSSPPRQGRSFGSQYTAIRRAYGMADHPKFEFVGIQDADIAPERRDYYECL